MLPPAAPADPYDIPESPTQLKKPPAGTGFITSHASVNSSSVAVNSDADRNGNRNGDINGAGEKEAWIPIHTSKETPKDGQADGEKAPDAVEKPTEATTDEKLDEPAEPSKADKNEDAGKEEKNGKPDTDDKHENAEKQLKPNTNTKPAAEAGPSSQPEPAARDLTTKSNSDSPNTLEVEIDEFVAHRIDESNATVEIQVKWSPGETTWETEWSLQTQTPGLVYKYWDEHGGRELATGLDVYHVFRILKRELQSRSAKAPKYLYEVQWVGYRRSECSWEHEDKVREIAPGELSRFEAKHGSAPSDVVQKRGVARKPGRPRKKAKLDD